MTDKLRDTFPVPISFDAGEQPTAAKLSAWANQTNRALENVEKALGDLNSGFFPYFPFTTNTPTGLWGFNKVGVSIGLTQTHLQILNLARFLGPASALSPRIVGGLSSNIVGESLPAFQNEFYLLFIPTGLTTSVVFSNATKFANLKADPVDVKVEGDYFIDMATGQVIMNNSESAATMGTVSYSVNTTADNMIDTYHGAGFNVIPHTNQSVKCTTSVSTTTGRFFVDMPIATHQQNNWDETGATLEAFGDLNFGAQMRLPDWLDVEYSGVPGTEICPGFLGLWDDDNDEFLDVRFFYVSDTRVETLGEDLEIGSDRYSIVVIGTDVARTLDNLRSRYRRHQHDGTEGDVRVWHEHLQGNAVGWKEANANGNRYAFVDHGDGDFPNHHPQYLGRWGVDSTFSRNAMLGDLLFAADDNLGGSQPPEFSLGNTSHTIYFGDEITGPGINYHSGLDGLLLSRKNVYNQNDYKWTPSRSADCTFNANMMLEFEPLTAAYSIIRAIAGLTVQSTNPGVGTQTMFLDLTPHLVDGATYTAFEINALPSNNGHNLDVVIQSRNFTTGLTTSELDETALPLVGTDVNTLDDAGGGPGTMSMTVDKANSHYGLRINFDLNGLDPTEDILIRALRMIGTHDTINRGG